MTLPTLRLGADVLYKLGATGQNLKVLLDGAGAYWAQNVAEGTGPGTWAWPA